MRVYAVWLPILPGDSRGRWDAEVLADRRVVDFWDEELVVGRWVAEHLDEMGAKEQTGGVYWDAFLVFDKEARWDAVPSPLVEAGATVIAQSEKLGAALRPLM